MIPTKRKTERCNKLPQVWQLVVTLFSILLGHWIGSSIKNLYEVETKTLYPASDQNLNSSFHFAYISQNHSKSTNISEIYVASNLCHAKQLPPRTDLDFSPFGSVGNETVRKPSYLLAIAVGIQQKYIVNKIVSKFSEDFAIILFHYDGKTSEWDQFEWSHRAIHISASKQTKWWYAKRFLHPDVVVQYEYIFVWDEDLGVEHFNAEEYLKLVKKYDLEISQPAITSEKGLTWKMTQKRYHVEVHRLAGEKPKNCPSPILPPCAGFVEIMAPVFSRKSWNCVWNVIQNDLVHGWGLDFAFWRCVEKPHEKIGVVDAQWIRHLVLPTLQHQDKSINGKQPRVEVRARSFAEWKEFEKRMKQAEKHLHTQFLSLTYKYKIHK